MGQNEDTYSNLGMKSNRVYVNPKFGKLSSDGNVRPVPFFNPSFIQHSYYHNYYNNTRAGQPKIHVNPKMLANLNSGVSSVSDNSAKNKFTKINPPRENVVIPNSNNNGAKNKFTKINPPRNEIKQDAVSSDKPSILARPMKPSRKLVNKTRTNVSSNIQPSSNKPTNKIVYKKLVKKSQLKKVNSTLNKPKSNIVFVGNEKFLVCGDKLKRIGSKTTVSNTKLTRRISVQGKTFIRKSSNLFVTESGVKPSPKTLKKVNVTCPIFRRLGVCRRNLRGQCPFVHDPKNVSVCRKFLLGECKIDGCHLSHNVTMEKMPTCTYFLEGCCTKIECPYLHVKINDDADVCIHFLQGFCKEVKTCKNLHVHVCPAFHKSGKCDKFKCIYPHRRIKRRAEISSVILVNSARDDRVKVAPSNCDGPRYYCDDRIENDDSNGSLGRIKSPVAFVDRPKIGSLPSFIAL